MPNANGDLVVDADGHVVELPHIWEQYLEPAFRQRAPRFVRDESGRMGQLIGETITGRHAMELSNNASKTMDEFARSGGWDPRQRLTDMDSEGIDAAVLFPSMSFYFCEVDDPALDAALCRAYNEWLADYCRAAPDRLYGVALLPLRDVDASVRELERTVRENGFRGAFVRPNPYADRPIHSRAYDRLWDCATSLGVAITVHEGLADRMPTLGRERFENPANLHVLSHPFEQMAACAGLINSGVMERHPNLHFAFLESGCGWLPFWLQRLDSHFDTWRKLLPELRLAPSEYFRRQCFISFDPEDALVADVVGRVGDDCVVWASDYPHPDSHFPGTMDLTLENTRDLSDVARRKILGTNAQRLFGLELRSLSRMGEGRLPPLQKGD